MAKRNNKKTQQEKKKKEQVKKEETKASGIPAPKVEKATPTKVEKAATPTQLQKPEVVPKKLEQNEKKETDVTTEQIAPKSADVGAIGDAKSNAKSEVVSFSKKRAEAPAKAELETKTEETKTEDELPACLTSTLDNWFKEQTRDLNKIHARRDGSPMREALSENGGTTPQSLKDWVLEHQGEKKEGQKAATQAPTCTTAQGFDMWLERQRSELSNITTEVESTAPVSMTTEEWRKKLDSKSNETLETWRSSIEDRLAAAEKHDEKTQRDHSHAHMEGVRELERSLEALTTKSESHQHILKQHDLLTDEVQFKKLHNLSSNMQDRIYATA